MSDGRRSTNSSSTAVQPRIPLEPLVRMYASVSILARAVGRHTSRVAKWTATAYRDLAAGTSGEAGDVARRTVVAVAASLAEVAPLVDTGVVRTVFIPAAQRIFLIGRAGC